MIGSQGKLPWDLPADLKRFKETTYGAPVIMGRKTFESIGRLLPGRKNIIITRDVTRIVPSAWTVSSLKEAYAVAGEALDVFVIGGGEIYRAAMADADRLHLTAVDIEIAGDAFFPAWPELTKGAFELDGKRLHFTHISREKKPADPSKNRPAFEFIVFDRVR